MDKSKKHIVFGAGLIGCYLGGVLTHFEHHTKLVCRPNIKRKLNTGIQLTDYLDNNISIAHLNVLDTHTLGKSTTDKENVCDFLWLTVKCTGVDQASKDILQLVGPNTIILCCQNGLGSDAIVRQYHPNTIVLRVMVHFNVVEIQPGHLHRGSEGGLVIETTSETKGIIDRLVKEINSNLIAVTQTNDMQSLLWAKLQLNLGNSVNALANIPVKAMLQQRDYRLVIALLMEELLLITKAMHIKLPKVTALPGPYLPWILRLPNIVFNLVATKMLTIDPEVRTSMWWDVSQGKKTEIDYLNGAIIEAAEKLNISTPANKKIIDLIKSLETSNIEKRDKAISGSILLEMVKGKQKG